MPEEPQVETNQRTISLAGSFINDNETKSVSSSKEKIANLSSKLEDYECENLILEKLSHKKAHDILKRVLNEEVADPYYATI